MAVDGHFNEISGSHQCARERVKPQPKLWLKLWLEMMAEVCYHEKMASRARNKLSVRQVASLTGVGLYSDGGGLYLRVRPAGRTWIFIGTFEGKRFELGLGIVHDVPLALAREKAAEIRSLLVNGKDPRFERAVAKQRQVTSFGAFAEALIDDIEGGFKNPKHRQQWRNTIKTYAQSIYNVPVGAVTTEHVLSVLQPIWLTKQETASRLRGRIERILDAAKVRGLRSGENPARSRGHLDLLLPKRPKVAVKHHAALPFADIAGFIAELRERPALAARALEFTILTAARSGEARGMTWAEIDVDQKVWAVPATRMKAGVSHQVPLSDAALAIIAALCKDGADPMGIVFAAPRGGAFSDMALAQLLKRMGYGNITAHGFRSTFRDWAGETTQFGREEVEMALAHTVASMVQRAYRRGRALEKRRDLMAAWAAYCGY